MKVRMNHAIELDQVPNKITEMTSEMNDEVRELLKQADLLESAAHLPTNSVLKYRLMSETLSDLKTTMSEAEQSVDDMISILGGYIKLLERESPTPLPAPVNPAYDFKEDPDLKGPDVPENKVRLPTEAGEES